MCIYMLSRVGDKRTPPTKRDGTHGCMHAGTSKSQRPTTPLNQHRIRTLDCIQSINARIDIDPKQTRGHGTGRGACPAMVPTGMLSLNAARRRRSTPRRLAAIKPLVTDHAPRAAPLESIDQSTQPMPAQNESEAESIAAADSSASLSSLGLRFGPAASRRRREA